MTTETLEQDLEVYRAMYSELKKENERLKAEINRLKRGIRGIKDENEPRQYQKTLNEISDNLDALER